MIARMKWDATMVARVIVHQVVVVDVWVVLGHVLVDASIAVEVNVM